MEAKTSRGSEGQEAVVAAADEVPDIKKPSVPLNSLKMMFEKGESLVEKASLFLSVLSILVRSRPFLSVTATSRSEGCPEILLDQCRFSVVESNKVHLLMSVLRYSTVTYSYLRVFFVFIFTLLYIYTLLQHRRKYCSFYSTTFI